MRAEEDGSLGPVKGEKTLEWCCGNKKKGGGAWESGGREKRPMSSQGMNPIKQVWGWFIVERKPADSEIFPPLVGFP